MDLNLKQEPTPLSIRRAFTGKTVFVIGATGFIGKVWLTMMLSQVQTFKKMYILIRGKGSQTGRDRFEQLINSSYVFEHLHQKFKYELSKYIQEKIEIVEGDVGKENLGLSDEQLQSLSKEVDLTVNFAGLVDFNPDLREAFLINVQGAMNVADFVRRCKNKKMVHISTCYVAGTKQGRIEEKVSTSQTPNGSPLNIEFELQWIDSSVEALLKEYNSQEQIGLLRKKIEDRNIEDKKPPFSEQKIAKTIETVKRKKIREGLTKLGVDRAHELGWTNTYTYTKGLAEVALKQRYTDIELVIFRPSIVESSFQFPFPGWNEGFNTSGPLAYLMKTWFRHLPLKKGNPFDVIPVDYVSRGLCIACAALLDGTHTEVYHCSTSDRNRLTIDQACQYTSESHTKFYREHGDGWRERWILSRWKTIPSRKDHLLSTPNMKKLFSKFERVLSKTQSKSSFIKFLFKKPYAWALRSNRKLEQTEKLLELFYPFIHDYRHIFETRSLFLYDVKENEFQFSIEQISWPDYWKDIQMPGLRKWCFPAIEAKSIEKLKPKYPFSFSTSKEHTNGHSNGNGNGKTVTNGKSGLHISNKTDADIQTSLNFQNERSEPKKVLE